MVNTSAILHNTTNDVDITGKVVLFGDATDGEDDDVDTAAELVADIQGINTALEVTSGGKAVILSGDADAGDGGAAGTLRVWFVDDSLDGTLGTIGTGDVVQVAAMGTLDVDDFGSGNFVFS